MTDFDVAADAPAVFVRATSSLATARVRPEVTIEAIPSPTRIAPHSAALAGEVLSAGLAESLHGSGRLILMYDEEQVETWGGPFRIVCFAQSPLEAEIRLDPIVSDVVWSWLTDALENAQADYSRASGTATRVLSKGYGELSDQGETGHLELRASWTPGGTDMSGHVAAWANLLCLLAGLPPTSDAVSLNVHKRERG